MDVNVTIIGAGIVGLAIAREISNSYKDVFLIEKNLKFGNEYIIPKPTDPRLITHLAPAVARAAMDSGVAREPIEDWDAYR